LSLELFYNVDVLARSGFCVDSLRLLVNTYCSLNFLLIINNDIEMIIIVSEPDLPLDCFHFSLGTLRMGVNLNCMYYSGHVF